MGSLTLAALLLALLTGCSTAPASHPSSVPALPAVEVSTPPATAVAISSMSSIPALPAVEVSTSPILDVKIYTPPVISVEVSTPPIVAVKVSTPAIEISTPAPKSVTVIAVGDIRLDAAVGRVAAAKGPGAPTAAVRSQLEGDILFGNLECALTERGEPMDKKWTFRAPPADVNILKAAGFDIVSLANNHVMDYGPAGLEDTLRALGGAGILAAGAGPDAAAARAPVFIERNGLRVGFLALTSTLPEEMRAGPERPGVAYCDFKHFPGWIKEAKSACDILIVSFHGGTELAPEPNDVQKAFVREALGAGADLVIGHHPHVLQAVETKGGAVALYSLGNFLFVSPTPGAEWTAIARITLTRAGGRAEFYPVRIGPGTLHPAGEAGRELIGAALDRAGALSREPERFRLTPHSTPQEAR